jgi:transposase-like protein
MKKLKKSGENGETEVAIATPQDRNNSFEPRIVEKHQRILVDNLEKQTIAMYGMGTAYGTYKSIYRRCTVRIIHPDYQRDHPQGGPKGQ